MMTLVMQLRKLPMQYLRYAEFGKYPKYLNFNDCRIWQKNEMWTCTLFDWSRCASGRRRPNPNDPEPTDGDVFAYLNLLMAHDDIIPRVVVNLHEPIELTADDL